MLQKNAPTLASKSTTSDCRELLPFKNKKEYLASLQEVLEQDYGVSLTGEALEEAGKNITMYLKVFLES